MSSKVIVFIVAFFVFLFISYGIYRNRTLDSFCEDKGYDEHGTFRQVYVRDTVRGEEYTYCCVKVKPGEPSQCEWVKE